MGPMLPLELLGIVAQHYHASSLQDLFRFAMLCRYARDKALPMALEHWARQLAVLLNKRLHWNLTVPDSAMNQDLTLLLRGLARYQVPAQRLEDLLEVQLTRETGVSLEFLRALFDMQVHTLLDAHWLRAKQGLKVAGLAAGDAVVRPLKYSLQTRIRDVYFYDAKTKQAVPLKRLPGLSTVEMPVKPTALVPLVESAMEKCYGPSRRSDTTSRLVWKGYKRIRDTSSEMRTLYFDLCKRNKESLVSHRPHKPALVCNAVLDNGKHHLFSTASEAKAVRSALYTCEYRRPAADPSKKYQFGPECCKQYVVAQHCTEPERFMAIFKRLGFEQCLSQREMDQVLGDFSDSDSDDSDDSI